MPETSRDIFHTTIRPSLRSPVQSHGDANGLLGSLHVSLHSSCFHFDGPPFQPHPGDVDGEEEQHFRSLFEEFAGKVSGGQVPGMRAAAGSGQACLHSLGSVGVQRAKPPTLGLQPRSAFICHFILSEAGRLFLCFGEKEREKLLSRGHFSRCVD